MAPSQDWDRSRTTAAAPGRAPSELFDVGADDVPRKVYLELTTNCNLQCAMCIRHAWDAEPGCLSRATWEELVGQLRDLPSLATVNFGGFGEPLLHPNVLECVGQVKAAGRAAELTTNGVLLNERTCQALIDLGLDRLFVSLDGPGTSLDAVFHDAGAAAAQANLLNLNRLRSRGAAGVPEVVLVFVASRRNIGSLPELRRRAWELGVSRILVTHLLAHDPALEAEILYGKWTTACRQRAPSPWHPAVEFPRLDPRTDATRIMDQLAAQGSAVAVRDAVVWGGGMRCRFAHEGRLAIDTLGRVSPCLSLLHAHHYYFRGVRHDIRPCYFGRIDQMPLRQIWDSEPYKTFRERVRRFEFSPCIDCTACDRRETNEDDCLGSGFPSCGDCLWAAGFIQCP